MKKWFNNILQDIHHRVNGIVKLYDTTLVIVLSALLLNLTACQNGRTQSNNGSVADSLSLAAEEMVRAVARTGDVERIIELTDSLTDENLLPPIKADFYRALACTNRGDTNESYDYLKKIVETYDADEEPKLYSRAASSLASYYMSLNQYEEALRVALPAFTCIAQDPDITSDRKGNLLTVIGGCQKELNRMDEAEKSFEQAYQYYKRYMEKEDVNLTYFRSCIIGMTNISSVYNGIETLNEQQKWIDRCDLLLSWYKKQPGADSAFVDQINGQTSLKRSEILLAQGKKEEAAKDFEEFLKTEYSKTDEARIYSCNYLSSIGRNAEAADIFQDFDRIAAEWDMEPNLEVIRTYLFPKFEFNYKAGRKDSALAVAAKIASLIAPAIEAQKNDAAAELATIYETQEKEAQIAHQRTELSQQRNVGLIFAIVSLFIFFSIFTLVRHRAAKRYAKVKSAQELMENELKIARHIQMSMVPSTFPKREGLDMYASMTPAKEVGGDLYGYVLSSDKLYFAVGDVSGKGVPASLLMAQATQLFRTLAAQLLMPTEICTRINDALCDDDNENGMFVTFFLGLIDLKTGHLDFCNAGHNPPVIGGGENKGDFLDMESNAPFGLWPGLKYEGEEIETIKGRPLFIYTDGLNEAENSQQIQLGDERVLDLLRQTRFASAQQVVETMAEAVSLHRNGAEPNDDLTMMCIKIETK